MKKTLLATVFIGATTPAAADSLVKVVNEYHADEGCRITKFDKKLEGDFDDDGRDEVVAAYHFSADTCGGGGTWIHANVAWLEQREGGWIVTATQQPNVTVFPKRGNPEQKYFDPIIHDMKWKSSGVLSLLMGNGKPAGSPPDGWSDWYASAIGIMPK